MAISVNWGTLVINVPKLDMPVIQASPFEIRQLDVNGFRLELKALESSAEGVTSLRTHNHVTETTLAGISYARSVEIINGYTVEFEDGQYGVSLIGANNNILDVKVGNQVSVLGNNSAGLINSEAINTQSYLDGLVWVDTVDGMAGTLYPLGTPGDEVNNMSNANVIRAARKLHGFHLSSPFLMLAPGDVVARTKWLGDSPDVSRLMFSGNDSSNCTFESILLMGTMNGRVTAVYSALVDLMDFQGSARECAISGNCTIDSTATGIQTFINCYSSVAGTAKPMVDWNHSAANGQFRGYIGGLHISNVTQNISISIDVISGSIYLDSTNTAGTIVVRGICNLVDETGPGCTVVTEGTISVLTNADKITELHKLQGLDINYPMTVTQNLRSVDNIDLEITGDGESVSIVTRQ